MQKPAKYQNLRCTARLLKTNLLLLISVGREGSKYARPNTDTSVFTVHALTSDVYVLLWFLANSSVWGEINSTGTPFHIYFIGAEIWLRGKVYVNLCIWHYLTNQFNVVRQADTDRSFNIQSIEMNSHQGLYWQQKSNNLYFKPKIFYPISLLNESHASEPFVTFFKFLPL